MAATNPSSNLFGYFGRYLHVQLDEDNHADSTWLPIRPEVLRALLGGTGLGTYLLLKHNGARLDPLRPQAPLVLALSPLVGSPITTSAKLAMVCKSPLTDRINDSLISGGLAIAAKRNGCDALVLQGRAGEPSILIIEDGTARLEPAGTLWGTSGARAARLLLERYGHSFEVAVIGPAGERLVRFATLSHAGRHAGRGGIGAVLGAKNIKAILMRGSHACRSARPDQLVAWAKVLAAKSLGPATAKYRELGTAANLPILNRLHALPTRNFQQGSFLGADKLAPESLAKTRARQRAACVACTIGCEHIYSLSTNGERASQGVRVEYENLFALGPLCGIDDPDTVLAASKRCDQLGIDTISAGGTIAFAMECVQRGMLAEPWLQFGSGEALLRALDLIGSRQGLGNRLAEGSRRLARELGPEASAFAPHVKGLELPGYEPRAMQALALGLAVGTRGADHNRSGAAEVDFSTRADRHHLVADTARLAIETEDKAALLDSLILCKFLRGALGDVYVAAAEILQLVTGWDVTSAELQQTAARIVNLRKWFNIQAGWTPDEDTLPDRFLQQHLPDDPSARLTRRQLQQAIEAYNRARGWTKDGWIGEARRDRLRLRLGLETETGAPSDVS